MVDVSADYVQRAAWVKDMMTLITFPRYPLFYQDISLKYRSVVRANSYATLMAGGLMVISTGTHCVQTIQCKLAFPELYLK